MGETNLDARLERVVAATRAAFVGALSRGDSVAAARVYAEGARLLAPSGEPIAGRESIEAFWRTGLETGVRAIELEELELERRDGVAFEIGRYALRLEPEGGETVVDRGKYLLVHERQADGAWLWAVEMFNPDAPPVTASRRGGGAQRKETES